MKIKYIFKNLIVLFAILGISSTFMPWLHYPKVNISLYGYQGDGILTGAIFSFIFLYVVFSFKKKNFSKLISFILGGLGLLMAIISYFKISKLNADKLDFSEENPILALGTAGFHQGIGLYVLGIAGFSIFCLFIIERIIPSSKKNYSPEINAISKKPKLKFILPIVLLFGILATFLIRKNNFSEYSKENFESTFKHDINKMGQALIMEDYETFIDINHTTLVQSVGGRDQLIKVLKLSKKQLQETGTSIKRIEFKRMLDVETNGSNIQAVLLGTTYMDKNGEPFKEDQRLLAVSENGGINWTYINLSDKTKAEIREYFPYLNMNLEF